jgi:anaerobic selenocysteine-containing dehydrogenase
MPARNETKKTEHQEHDSRNGMTRRDVIQSSALLGATGLPLKWTHLADAAQAGAVDYDLSKPENIVNTVCLQCNTGCGIKVKLVNGVAVKIDGNPLAPTTMVPHLPANTSPFVMAGIDGAICPKGQAGLQSVYDPYRTRKVLKRAGKRGENKWVSIPFDQAVKEIVEGGPLFSQVPGEENRLVAGLKEICALRDPKVAAAMDKSLADLKQVIKDVRKKKLPETALADAIAAFKAKHKDHLDTLIDPDHPDLGPKNNQLVFAWGRMKAGRGDFVRRFTTDAFGSVNAHGHTTVCQGSLYFTGKAMSEQWDYDEKSKEVKWTGGDKFYWQADTGNAEFILFVGASPFEGNYGPPARTPRLTNNLAAGKLKIAVADPRFSKTAAKAWKWLPIKPGFEAALGLAMIRWIIENNRFDARFLQNANKAAAKADGEPNWSNATWLVKLNDKGEPDKFLRSHEIGLAPVEKRKAEDGTEYPYERFVVMSGGKPLAVDANDAANAVEGDLLADATVKLVDGKEVRVKSSFQLLLEAANEQTIEEWAAMAGLQAKDIVEIAQEFVSHGKKAVADIHRGVSQHTNGFYNCFVFNCLNMLLGNYDWKGGYVKASAWNITGDSKGKPIEGKPFFFPKLHPNKAKAFGLSSIRHDAKYEETTLFSGYPAKRPFYPLSSDVYQEIIPSIADQYPYPIKCLILYMGSPVYALPAGHALIPILMDLEKLPLYIASDITVGESTMYADYIFPDLTYLERWEFHGSHPSFTNKQQPVRQPAIAPIPETVDVFGEKMPISLESMLMAFSERLGLSGFGKDGMGTGMDLAKPDDFYLRMVANIAAGDKAGEAVPDADDREMELFFAARRHLPKTVFDPDRWKTAVGEAWWRKVVFILNRGGRYEDYDKGYDGALVKHKYGKLLNMYSEKAAGAKNAMSGKAFSGVPRFIAPYQDIAGNPVQDDKFDLKLTTHRDITMTKSRTIGNYWLTAVKPTNVLLINKADATQRGLKDGDMVKVISASNPSGVWDLGHGKKRPLKIKLKAVQGMRPGTVSFALGFGHWAYGASDITVDGKVIKAEERRAAGTHLNAAMRVDPVLKNTSLADPVGASVAFYDTNIKLIKTT